MARNYYDSVTAATIAGQTFTRPEGVGYDVTDDLQSIQNPTTKFDECAHCGDRSRSLDVDTQVDIVPAFDAFKGTASGSNTFTLEGIKCTDGLTETRVLDAGTGFADTFELSADGKSPVTASVKVVLVGDPTIHS